MWVREEVATVIEGRQTGRQAWGMRRMCGLVWQGGAGAWARARVQRTYAVAV